VYPSRYKILAPAAVDKAKEPKDAAAAVLDSTGLDPDMYRLGHTKARLPIILSSHYSVVFSSLSRWPRDIGLASDNLESAIDDVRRVKISPAWLQLGLFQSDHQSPGRSRSRKHRRLQIIVRS